MADELQTGGVYAQRPSFSGWIGVVLLFLVFGLLVLVTIGAGPRGEALQKKRIQNRLDKLKVAREDAGKLNTYAWVDKSKGTARIPIYQAMHIMLTDLQKPPAPAGPIAPEAQVGGTQTTAPATAPAGSPAAAASPSGTPAARGGNEPKGPAATVNPPAAAPGTQPGAAATPAARPQSQSGQPNLSGSPTPLVTATPHGSPLPVPGKTP